jgi:hypothetical protein
MKLKNNFNKKKIRTIKNHNQKNEDHIRYKNKISIDEIQRQINLIKDSRPKTLQLKELRSNLLQKTKCK